MRWYLLISILLFAATTAIALPDRSMNDLRAEDVLIADSRLEATKAGLHVWFSLDRPKGGLYRRPYLAVWLEDEDGFPVKTGVLWMQTDQPGPR